MDKARILVLAIAGCAGLAALYLASGSDDKPAPAPPVAQLPTVDILVAKTDIGLGQAVKPEDLQWQTWPAATASASFMRRDSNAEAIKDVTGSIARAPFIQGEPIREQKLVKADGSRLHGRDPADRHAGGIDRNFTRDRRRRLHPAE
ncbi:Flp pilus assembly protein CpaB [Bradyrhizobium sp. JR3.5]